MDPHPGPGGALTTPSKILCVGRNYRDHAAELGKDPPAEPLLFLKPPSALVGDGEPVVLPAGVGRVDFEGEIAVRVGRRLRHASEEEAHEAIDALLPLNDVTARDLQRRDDQWTRAKGFDTFCPVGAPVPIEGDDLGDLGVLTRVNGEERQRGLASAMLFSIPFLLSWASSIMTLEPGDLLATGTPAGVGPLEPGDEVEVEIPGIGSVRNPVVAAV